MAPPSRSFPNSKRWLQHGSREKRAEALQRITALFLDGAEQLQRCARRFFDDVFGLLIEEIESKARAELSNRLAPVSNAPVKVLRSLPMTTISPSPGRC